MGYTMATEIAKYSLLGEKLGTVNLNCTFDIKVKDPSKMVKDWVVNYNNNQRQWSANTQTRSEVSCSTKKIRAQKGTGRARAGDLSAPQRVGGGRVGCPKPKFNQHNKMNKHENNIVFSIVLSDFLKNGSVFIIDNISMDMPKTSKIFRLITLLSIRRRPLFLYGDNDINYVENFSKSISNIHEAIVLHAKDVSIYELLLSKGLILTESALQDLEYRLNKVIK